MARDERLKVSSGVIRPKKKTFGTPEPRNVILFIMDSVPEYQFQLAKPNYFTKLANSFRGFYYDDAWSPCNWTLPAMTSFMTGRLPHSDGSEQVLESDFEMLDTLKETGYNTYFFTGLGLIDFWGYKDKFTYYKNFFNTHVDKPEMSAQEIVDDAIKVIKEPYFAVFLMAETHYWFETPFFKMPEDRKMSLGRFFPRKKPTKEHLQYLLDRQIDSIRYLDNMFEKLHEKLPGDPVVIVTADHGTVLKDDCDRYFHAWGNHVDMFNVPLLIYNISMIKRLDPKVLPNGKK